jgi:hypothetical protein
MILYEAIILLFNFLAMIIALRALKSTVKNQTVESNYPNKIINSSQNKQNPLVSNKPKLFISNQKQILLLTWGMILLFLSQIGKLFFLGIGVIPEFLPQILILFANVLFVYAFGHFWYNSAKFHKLEVRERLFFLGVVALVLLGIFLQIHNYLSAWSKAQTYGLLSALNLLLAALAFLLTFAINPRIKAGIADNSLKYLSSGIFMYLLATSLHFYIEFGGAPSWLEAIYVFLTCLALIYFLFGFLVAKNFSSLTSRLKSNFYKL